MITEDQSEVVAFLARPSTHDGQAVDRIDTHASIVFLAGARALKLKRAVRYDYLDFSTADRRRELCEAELRINRRTAPGLYRSVIAVTRETDGSLALGGTGTPVDWLVDMARFDQQALFDRLAARDALDLSLMVPLGEAIARFHDEAGHRPDRGGSVGMRWVADGNAADFAAQPAGTFDADACRALVAATAAAIDRHRARLDARQRDGFVRQCHGDLHLRNIVLLDGRPTLFDAIEFNDAIACIDVFYDLAFLLMDLERRRLPRHANAVWNAYLAATGDLGGIPLLPLFLSCRAAVRAKTSATAAGLQDDAGKRRDLQETAREYLAMARQLLEPAPACLVAIGGFSGSGKSTIARAIAPALGPVPGAVHIRSDEVRKQLCGVGPLDRLGPEGYTDDVTRRVYDAVTRRAAEVVQAGHAALVDAVFARPADRAAIERAAAAAGVPFAGIWLEAPGDVLQQRVSHRVADASDADALVVRAQIDRPTGGIDWHRVDASGEPGAVERAALDRLRAVLRGVRDVMT